MIKKRILIGWIMESQTLGLSERKLGMVSEVWKIGWSRVWSMKKKREREESWSWSSLGGTTNCHTKRLPADFHLFMSPTASYH